MTREKVEIKTESRRRLTRRGFLKVAVRSGIGLNAVALGSMAYGKRVEPGWLDVSHHELRLPRLSPAFDGFTIAHFSDIHADEWMTPIRLRHIVNTVNAQKPDFIAVTGDFVSYFPKRFAHGLISELSRLRSKHGCGAVLGNHDHWSGATVIRDVIRQSGMIDLNNAVHTLRRGQETLHLCGVDDPWVGKPRPDLVLAKLPSQGAAVLLAHEPDFADAFAAPGRFDLQLSGHSHGGQVRLPGCSPWRLPAFGQKYHTGLYQVDDMKLYTNRGVGTIGLRVRFNCRPEIALLTLRTSESA